MYGKDVEFFPPFMHFRKENMMTLFVCIYQCYFTSCFSQCLSVFFFLFPSSQNPLTFASYASLHLYRLVPLSILMLVYLNGAFLAFSTLSRCLSLTSKIVHVNLPICSQMVLQRALLRHSDIQGYMMPALQQTDDTLANCFPKSFSFSISFYFAKF